MTKYSIQFTRLVCFICIHTAYLRQLETVDILMKKAKPLKEDTYLCSAYAVNKADSYIVKFEALADADIVHHILLYGCPGDADDKRQDIWQCPPVCKDGIPKILFAWARNADPIYLPEGVGFHVGQLTMVKTIVLQAHYAKAFHEDDQSDSSGIRLHITDERQPKVAGVFLMLNYNFTVPPHQQSKVVAGYHHNDTGFHLIGKGNPQWPQTFYPTLSDVRIRSGDKLVARCTFDSTDVDKSVHVGPNGSDEMCNFYFMFSTDSSVSDPDSICANVSPDNIDLLREIPADSDVPLPPNPALDQAAMGHHHHHHGMPGHVDNIAESSQSAVHDVDHVKDIKSSEPAFGHLMYNKSWSLPHDVIGQVAGLATDHDGNLYVFHRGSRKWDSHSFDKKNNFLRQDEPIREEVIIIFSRDGKTISKFGSQQYFMPHGMHVDGDGNIWLTDVAMHQVFRIPVNSTTPNLILGEKFIHGSDERHFCKPTDVAVLASGEFFVSDGYCNHRVMKFSKDGVFLMQFGENNLQDGTDAGVDMRLTVPHSLTLAPDKQLLFLADREHGRIVCFNFEGATQYVIEYGQFGSRVFAVDYCPSHGGLLYAVNGPSYDGDTSTLVQGFTLRVTTTGHQLQNTWNLPSDRVLGFQSPHDVVSATTDQAVYVGELSPAAVWKFSAKPMEDSNVSGKGSSPSLLSESSSPLKPVIDVMSVKNSVKSNTTTNDTRHSTHGSDSGRKKSLFEVSFIIGIMLAVPVILLLIISIGMRLHRRGWCPGVQNVSSDKVFSLQHILGSSHKGFNKLSQEDSDEDGDDLNDSDYNEEYRKPMIG